MASSSRRSSSPFNCRRVSSSPYSSTSSSSSIFNGRSANRSCSSSASSFFGSGIGYGVRSRVPSHARIDSASIGSKICASGISAEYASGDDFTGELLADAPRSGDSISVTIRFRPLSEREFQRGDEIAWHADGDKIVRSEYNTETAYAFDKVFGPSASSDEVYEVAAGSVVRAAMEGVNGTVFAYGVTSSGKTHTMHED